MRTCTVSCLQLPASRCEVPSTSQILRQLGPDLCLVIPHLVSQGAVVRGRHLAREISLYERQSDTISDLEEAFSVRPS